MYILSSDFLGEHFCTDCCGLDPGQEQNRYYCSGSVGVGPRPIKSVSPCFIMYTVADLHSKILDARPPWGPNSFNFMQFLGKFGKIVCWRPPLGSWRPLLGEILDPPLVYEHLLAPCSLLGLFRCFIAVVDRGGARDHPPRPC